MKKIYTVLSVLFTLCGSLQVWAQGIIPGDPGNFITTWKTDNDGTSNDDQITIPTYSGGSYSYNYNIYWEEVDNAGNSGTETGVTGSITLTFPSPGTYRVEINGDFPRIYFNNGGDKGKILTVDQWGGIQWKSMARAFYGARNMQLTTTVAPDLSQVSDMSWMFSGASSFNQDLSSWDVSSVTYMTYMFSGASSFNQDLSSWDVSSVKYMDYMFYVASSFNQDLSSWDVSSVKYMRYMFRNASSFNQDLSSWDVSSVTDMSYMFDNSALSVANYDATLIGWAAQSDIPQNLILGAHGLKYCQSQAARQSLIDDHGWTISGDTEECAVITPGDPGNFIITWKTDNEGTSNDNQITIPTYSGSSYSYNYNIYWEKADDASISGTEMGVTGSITLTFPSSGTYRVEINGDFPHIYFNNGGDKDKILTIDQWGSIQWKSMRNAFYGAKNMQLTTTVAPDLSQVSDMRAMFGDTETFNQDLSSWDVSSVTNMSSMFRDTETFNQDLSSWDVSKVSTMLNMFSGAKAFNGSLAGWKPGIDLADGCSLSGMFSDTEVFNQDLDSWDVSKVGDARYMFSGAKAFNSSLNYWKLGGNLVDGCNAPGMFRDTETFDQGLSSWDVSKVSNMGLMFQGAKAFNSTLADWNPGIDLADGCSLTSMFRNTEVFDQDLSSWDVSKVNSMQNMFHGAKAFNSTLADWNPGVDLTDGCNLFAMFRDTEAFNQDLSSWDVSKVNNMNSMFSGAIAFNSPLDDWNPGVDLTDGCSLSSMFRDTEAFDQDLNSWDISSVRSMSSMFDNSPLSVANYDATLMGWAAQSDIPQNLTLGANGLKYCQSQTARQSLIDDHGWTISGDTEECFSFSPSVDNILYVNQSVNQTATGYTGSGNSWANAIPELADALQWAGDNHTQWTSTSTLQIWVAQGEYQPESGQSFKMLNNVEIYGGFEGNETDVDNRDWNANTTTLKGNGNSVVYNNYTSGNPLTNSAILDGFTITGGNAANGGGIHNYKNSSPTLMNVIIINNTASNNGGGMYNDDFSSPVLINSVIRDNSANGGGGICNLHASSPVLRNVIISNNTAASIGGGVYNHVSSPVLTNVIISNNTASNGGGGMSNYYSTSAPQIYNSIVSGNTLTDGTTVDNILNEDGSAPEFYNSLVQGSGGSVSWDDNFGTDGGDNIDADPEFTDIANGDYTLAISSPAINAGNNTYYTNAGGDLANDLDLAGNPRLSGANIDMGAYEYQITPIQPNADNILYVNQSVDQSATGYTGSGDSWANAIPELADALQWAREQHDADNDWLQNDSLQIYVAKGKYLPKYKLAEQDNGNFPTTDRDKSFLMVKNVQLYGGFPDSGNSDFADRDWESYETILSGDLGTPGDDSDNAYHVVVSVGEVGNALLDGFSIQDGNADRSNRLKVYGVNIERRSGGGIYNHGSSPELKKLKIIKNNSRESGGGIYNLFSSPVLVHVEIIENSARYNGGGVYSQLSSPSFINTVIKFNVSERGGGGIYNYDAFPEIRNSLITDNYAEERGGGIYNQQYADFDLKMKLINVTIANNHATQGGGIYNHQTSPELINSLVFGNGENVYNYPNTSEPAIPVFKNSLIEGSGGSDSWDTTFGTDGSNNIDGDPLFTDPANGDYSLQACSPAVNAGSNSHYAGLGGGTKDLTGNPRVYDYDNGGIIDMGAFEFQGEQVDYDNVVFEDTEVTYDGEVHTITVTNLPTNITASYEVKNAVGDVVTEAVHAGVYTFTATLSGCGPDKTLTATLTIEKAALMVVADDDQSKVYSETDPVLTYAVSGFQDSDDGSILTGSLDRTAGEDVGTYPIDQGDLSAGANYDIDFTGTDFKIIKATLTVIADDNQSKVYGEVDPVLTYTVSGFQGSDDETVLTGSLSRIAGEDVGSYPIDQGDLSAGTNYEIDFIGADFEISKATLTVIAEANQSKLYGEADPVLTYSISGFQGSDDETLLTGALSRTAGEDVGTYPINQDDLSAGANYDIDFTGADFEITKATLTVIAEANQSKVYGEADPVLTYTVSGYQGADDESILSGSLHRTAGEDVGNYPIDQGDLSAGANYDIDFTGADFTITQATLTVIADSDQSKVYGETDPILTYSVSGFQGSDDETVLTGSLSRTAGEDVGNYPIDQGDLSAGGNYEIDFTGVDFTITQATLTVIADDNQSKVYGEVDPVLTYTASGYQGSDDESILTGELDRAQGEDVGTYPMTQGDLSAGDNYDVDFVSADFVIRKATLTVTADSDQSKVYGDADPTFTYVVTGFQGTDDESILTGSLSRAAGEDVGSYPIDQGDLSAGSNYEIDFTGTDFKITKASIAGITLDDATFTYDGTSKSLAIAGTLPTGISVTYTGNDQTDAGSYTVTAEIDGGNNYEDLTLTAELIIRKAEQSITFEPIDLPLYRDTEPFELQVFSNSGLPLDIEVSHPEIADLLENTLHIHRVGRLTLTARQGGNDNYLPADPVEQEIDILPDQGSILPVRVHQAVSPNGDGVNDFLRIEGIEQYPDNQINIFNANGAVLYSTKGYNNKNIRFDGRTASGSLPEGTYFYVLEVRVEGKYVHDKGFFVIRY